MGDQTPAPNEGQGSQDRQTPPIPDLKQEKKGSTDPQSPSTPDQTEGQGSQDRKTPTPG